MPILEVGGKKLCQTITICRFLGREFKLAGKDAWESGKCDEYVDSINDLFAGEYSISLKDESYKNVHVFTNFYFPEWVKYFYNSDPEAKAKAHESFKTGPLPKYLGKFNDIKGAVGGKWLVGDSLTWADIFIADKLDRLQESEGVDVLDKYPNLKAFKNSVFAVPSISAYIQQRPAK